MNPMDTFERDAPCRVHDKLNDKVIDRNPEWAANYRQYADRFDDGVIEWDGLLLDGWSPL